jgi:creatine kinase
MLSHSTMRSASTLKVNDWDLASVAGLPGGGVLDLKALQLPAMSMRVRVGRNLQDFPLPGAMSKEDRIAMEDKLSQAFQSMQSHPSLKGSYLSLTPGHPAFVPKVVYNRLVKDHIMFKDMAADSYLVSAGIASHWPYGRGAYVSDDKRFIIWVGEEDHLRIMTMQKGTATVFM